MNMVAFGKKVVKFRIPILIISILLLIPAGLGYVNTRVNYDVLTYLPEDIETMQGQDILVKDFGTGAFSMFIVDGMEDKKILLDNIDKIHTTEMGIDRIKRNLKIDTADVVEYCKNKVLDKNCNIYKQGKNWYCEVENIKITINSYSYTIITAHIVK